jgi:hypothetical protein
VRLQSAWAKDKPILRDIKHTANRMPIRSGIYILGQFGNFAKRLYNGDNAVKKSKAHLDYLSEGMGNVEYMSPDRFYQDLRITAQEYAGMVYALDGRQRMRYIELCAKSHPKIPVEKNALASPALFAESDVPIERAEQVLALHLYRMPFYALYKSANTGLKIEKMKRKMAIGGSKKPPPKPDEDDFDNYIKQIEGRIRSIDAGKIVPVDDESFKEAFLDKAAESSGSMDTDIIGFISTMMGSKPLFDYVSKMLRKV